MLTVFTTMMAQTKKDYAANWKKVEAFEKKGLTKSALQEVMVIYNLAIKEGNDAQQIKSSMYQIKYRNMVEQDSHENNIFFIDTLIAKAKAPAKNILQSMQAEMFWQYIQNNRWKFYDRTALKEEKSKDISTWSLDKLHATIAALYNSSLLNESILKATKLTGFDAIMVKGQNTRQLRPTLYDFLTHRALEYFTTDERDITKPAYEFTINDPNAFADAALFAAQKFETKDTASLHHKALKIFQDILQFHLNDKSPDALIDADLNRLVFVNQYSINTAKEKLYEAALKNIENKYSSSPASAQAAYLRAQLYFTRGQSFDPNTNTTHQFEIKRAKELAEATAKKFPKTEGGTNSQNLVYQILQPALNLQTEQVNIPGQPFRSLLSYKNAPVVYFRVVKTSREQLKKLDVIYEKQWKQIVELPSVKSWNINMPDPKDYQGHSAEIKIDPLGVGTYMILASLDKDFSLAKNIIAKQIVYVSNISYINNENNYYILNRDSGKPFANTPVQVWESKYNYTKGMYEEVKGEKYTTDKNGLVKIKKIKDNRYIQLQIKTADDELFMDNNHYTYSYNTYENDPKPTSFLFSDRSIYRPGQLVYFKGIVIQNGNKITDKKILPLFKSKVQLKDANDQVLQEVDLTTNEYGSYHASFKLPEGLLNGQFTLYDETTGSSLEFSVEEYKRPKFSTEIKKPEGTYRLNDSIHVTGTAKAYAGNNVDGAAVKYRVVRKVRYPIWWGGGGGFIRKGRIFPPYGRSEEMEITNGETITDANGEFHITFKALPDESVDKKAQPTFYYEVSADVTDINGETRSGETSVGVAYQMLQLNINAPEKIKEDSLSVIKISSTNLNDIFEKSTVNLTIYKVRSPKKIFRERFWGMPDQFTMSKDEYNTYFPYDVYKDEDNMTSWPVGDKIIDITDTTSADSKFNFKSSKLPAGWYKIIVTTKDKYGEEVRSEKFIQVTNAASNKKITEPIAVIANKASAEPGDKIDYTIKTGFENIWLIQTLSRMDSNVVRTYIPISANNNYNNQLAVAESDRGGIALNYVFVQHNRVYVGIESFHIPWSNKDLNISYTTFRDKLLPGAKEKWTVKISGNKGDKVAAEILTGMYDASLDQFMDHNWAKLDIWPGVDNITNWENYGFKSVSSQEYNNANREYATPLAKSYDRLIDYIGRYYGYDRLYKSKAVMRAPAANQAAVEVMADAAGAVTGAVKDSFDGLASKEEEMLAVLDSVSIDKGSPKNNIEVQVRKNFNETAFFFPDLKTDAQGNVSFEFTIPEALTEWKLMTLAHTKELASGYSEKTLVTQKPLMIQPNAPRFMREGDKMEFTAKIVNLEKDPLSGTVELELIDAITNKIVDGIFKNNNTSQRFTVAAGQSTVVTFPIEIPINYNSALLYRIKAIAQIPGEKDGSTFSDGEEMALPVLTNRTLVTESLPLNIRNQTTKNFKFDKLLNSASSSSLTTQSLTVEYTTNPAWYAVQSLPYLMEYPYECAEQTFNRYYANILATHITSSIPKIKQVFEKWKTTDTAALLSNLQKNEELKSILLQETPWVMQAENEAKQKRNIALLFDMVRMSAETEKAINKLKEMQSSGGGFVWFKGGPDDRFITQYILTGIGHLRNIKDLSPNLYYNSINDIVDKALPYLDKKMKEEYDYLLRVKVNLKENHLSQSAIQYLYMRSFFKNYAVAPATQTAYNYYVGQAKKYWLNNSKYMQAMIALSLHRMGDAVTSKAIIKSLKENAIQNEELGMYWKEWSTGGYYWYQAPIESQSLMIEAFSEIDKNVATVDDLKTWLLKQKQTQNWRTTKATAEACYALLMDGTPWLGDVKEVSITLGSTTISSNEVATESGTGYFKTSIESSKVKPEMGNITVNVKPSEGDASSTSWGSVYWQYFEDLDKITPAETPLKLNKKLFIERNSDKGPVLEAIYNGTTLKVGDKIKVRIELKVDRDMEYIHMKDMRAACMEPVNVISSYKWQGGLGYYESTKDASTNFFFGWLPRGSYVFEYPMFVTHNGNFSNGITTIQCMYAPEFTSHSEGVRVQVK